MKGCKEYRDWVNELRKRHGKKNGVIPGYCFDDYLMEIAWNNSKKHYKRNKEKKTWRRR